MQNPSVITEVKALRKDVTGLKQDVNGLKQDVSGLKTETSALRKDVNTIKETMALRKESDVKFERVMDELARLRWDTDDLKKMKGIIVEIRTIAKSNSDQMEKFTRDSKYIFDNDRTHDVKIRGLQEVADEHEKRITVLERGK